MSRFMARYSAWTGKRTSKRKRLMVFLSNGFKSTLRSKWTILALAITYGLILVPRLFMAMMPGQRFNPNFYFTLFDEMGLFIILYSAVVGSGIIANDWNDKSIVLYFTKGLSKAGYVAGKLMILVASLSLITILPLLILFSLGLISSNLTFDLLRDNIWVLAAGLSMGLYQTIFLTFLIAGLSSLLNDRRYTGVALFSSFILSRLVSDILYGLNGNDMVRLASIQDNFTMVGTYLFRLDGIYSFSRYYSFFVLLAIILIMASIVYYNVFIKELRT